MGEEFATPASHAIGQEGTTLFGAYVLASSFDHIAIVDEPLLMERLNVGNTYSSVHCEKC